MSELLGKVTILLLFLADVGEDVVLSRQFGVLKGEVSEGGHPLSYNTKEGYYGL